MGGDLTPGSRRKGTELLRGGPAGSLTGGNLDRIQIVKGWVDAAGKTQEKVYDVAWSDERAPDDKGKLPAVGNTVNVKECTYENSIGSAQLLKAWTDPNFDASQAAFYYLRVLEIPTPRWTAYDAMRYGAKMPKEAPMTTQQRAYSSPIWYSPGS